VNVVILAGGRGSRLNEDSARLPKPMVEIGGKPILWHIMNGYAAHGFTCFLIACGYRAEVVKEYFHNFFVRNSDFAIDLRDGSRTVLNSTGVDWRIAVVDTGLDVMTGGRIRRLRHLIGDQTFMVTYGDGVSDIDLRALLAFHRRHGKLATVTAVRPPSRFGSLALDGEAVREFSEKPATEGWINGGFFVFEPAVFEYLDHDQTVLEREPLERLAAEGQLMAFRHTRFWQPMDTPRDRALLESLWAEGQAPWQTWMTT
jgi:glucose-1-phosphate cytidylyltransferase